MNTAGPDEPPNEGQETENTLVFRFWILGMAGGCLLLVLLTWGLNQVFDLTKDRHIGVLALPPILLAVGTKPRAYREAAIVAVLGGIAGALAWPCLTAVFAFADSLEPLALKNTVWWLGGILCPILLAVLAAMVYQPLTRRVGRTSHSP